MENIIGYTCTRFFLESPFIERTYKKPLGYAGDFEMMNMIYRNGYEGKTLFGKFINHYTLNIDPACTNRNRILYIVDKIRSLVPELLKKHDRIRILNVACGPSIEIQQLLKEDPISDYLDVTLMDASKESLHYAQSTLEALKSKYRRKTTFSYINKSIFSIIRGGCSREILLEPLHITYSLGLLEYLSNVTVRKLLRLLYHHLTVDGFFNCGTIFQSQLL